MARTGLYNDWGKTSRQMSYAFLKVGKRLKESGLVEFDRISKEFLEELDRDWPRSTTYKKNGKTQKFGGDHDHPWYSGQLHDSVAIRVADRNRTVKVNYMPVAAQMTKGGKKFLNRDGSQTMPPEYDRIIGTEAAAQAVNSSQYYFLPGMQIQLIIGVPYANKVNDSGRHRGFADEMMNPLVDKVNDYLQSLTSKEGKRIIADI